MDVNPSSRCCPGNTHTSCGGNNDNCTACSPPDPKCGSYHGTKCTEGDVTNLSDTNVSASWSCKNTDGKTVNCPAHNKCDCNSCSPPSGTCPSTLSPQCVIPPSANCDNCRGNGSASCCNPGEFHGIPDDTTAQNNWTCKNSSGKTGCSCRRPTVPSPQCVIPPSANCDNCRGNGSASCCNPGEFHGIPDDTTAQNNWTCINSAGSRLSCSCTRPTTPTTQPPQCSAGQYNEYNDKSSCESNIPEREFCERLSNGCWTRKSVCSNSKNASYCGSSIYFHSSPHESEGACIRYHASECVNEDVLCESIGGHELCYEFWDCSEGRVTD